MGKEEDIYNLQKLEDRYCDLKRKAEKEGFDMSNFEAKKSFSKKIKWKETIDLQVEELYKRKKKFSCSCLWTNMDNMMCKVKDYNFHGKRWPKQRK